MFLLGFGNPCLYNTRINLLSYNRGNEERVMMGKKRRGDEGFAYGWSLGCFRLLLY